MDRSIFNEKDLKNIRARGIDPEEILGQIEIFKKGVACVNLIRPCRIGDGIKRLDEIDIERLNAVYSEAQSAGRAMKFVPASGAATRMFKELMSVNAQPENIDASALPEQAKNNDDYKYLLSFIENITRFPFYDDLKSLMSRDGIYIEKAVSEGHYKDILEYTLYDRGLNLAGLPKALISFHKYNGYSRTPIEEHLVESAAYTIDGLGKARVHFTVSMEHEQAIKTRVNNVKGRYERSGIFFEIGYSYQKPSTETIAVNRDNTLFREEDGSLIFRPGGHGALLENLSDLKGDIIFIKNIDNIAPDRIKDTSTIYKKALAGYLVELQDRIFSYLKRLENAQGDEDLLKEILTFISDDLSISLPDGMENQPVNLKTGYLFDRLNRPIRVCGMVRNQAEPGGGPFWVKHADGGVSLQIVEKSQINTADEEQRRILESSTHFNPADLVCGVRDYNGRPFDLKRYVDPDTGFISVKSKDGMELKALELPGLWNGAMAFWNTVFVEVPLITFNPVKTIFDLLRDEHQPEDTLND
jgi:hypothetical protein